ncbi:hypothetical protein ACWGDX_30445 [Streptomyces sp. NPDC055025]
MTQEIAAAALLPSVPLAVWVLRLKVKARKSAKDRARREKEQATFDATRADAQQRQAETAGKQREDLTHLVRYRIPALVASGGREPGPIHSELAATEFGSVLDSVLNQVHGLRTQWVQASEGEQQARAELARTVAEMEHLAAARMPSYADQLVHERRPVAGLLHPELTGTDADRVSQAILDALAGAARATEVRVDEAAQTIVREIGTRLVSQASDMETRLERVQRNDQFGDPEVMTGLVFDLDRAAVRMRRTADQAVVVCGGSPAQARERLHLADLLAVTHAQVTHPDRVKLESHLPAGVDLGVVDPVAEPLAMVVTALLDNAAFHTGGDMPATAAVFRSGKGVSVVVEDSGHGLDTVERQEFARRMLVPEGRLQLTDLGMGAPLGLATVRRLTHRFPGISVELGLSASGGVKATVHVDETLLTTGVGAAASASAPLPARSRPAAAVSASSSVAELPAGGDSGARSGQMPRRKRERPQVTAAPAVQAARPVTPEAARQRYAGYNDVLRARNTDRPVDGTNAHHLEEGSQ